MLGDLDKVEHRKADSSPDHEQGFELVFATAVAGFVLTAALARKENKKKFSEPAGKPKTSV
jgi:hypothetical protein